MKTNYLFPNKFKLIGWLLFIPSVVLGVCYLLNHDDAPAFLNVKMFAVLTDGLMNIFSGEAQNSGKYFKIVKTNLLDELVSIGLIIGAIFIAFSKQKNEDEFIAKIRLESLLWATYVNYIVLILMILFVYGLAFYWVMIFNMFTILFFFLIRFYWILFKTKKAMGNEK